MMTPYPSFKKNLRKDPPSDFLTANALARFEGLSREEICLLLQNLENRTAMGRHDLSRLMQRQDKIQREQFGFDVDDMSLTDIAGHIMQTKQHLADEVTETLNALGGEKYGKAAWKYWKQDHAKVAELTLDDLTEDEYEELVGEVADVMIFALNIAFFCGVSGYALAHAIYDKQDVNIIRQEQGY